MRRPPRRLRRATGADMPEWRDIAGFDGRYRVSDEGVVWSTRLGRALRPGRKPSGHLSVCLGKGNSRDLHVLVLEAFAGQRPAGAVGRHLDGDAGNNRLCNLEWSTYSANGRDKKWHAGQANYKLSPEQSAKMRTLRKTGMTLTQLAAQFGVSKSQVHNVVSGKHHADT